MTSTTKNMLVAGPVLLLLLAIAIPNFIPTRRVISTNACENNLRWINSAKIQWALQKRVTNGPVTWDDLLPFLGPINTKVVTPFTCPNGGAYTIGDIGIPPKCSISGDGHTLKAD